MEWEEFDWLIDVALEEDAARRDVTTLCLVAEDRRAEAEVRAGAAGVICGLPLAERVAARFDGRIEFEQCTQDGDRVSPGTVVARLRGPAASILSVERTMLNFLQQLSGVATLTARFVEKVKGTGARIYDTRKTTPGWRQLQKYAVRCGGGVNHRMSLADMVLIKDNHLALMAGATGAGEKGDALRQAVSRARAACPGLRVEVEVESLEQLEQALAATADVIMLDNMAPEQVRKAVEIARQTCGGSRPQLEVSGGVNFDSVRAYAEAGADIISIGALTHSADALDLSLEMLPSEE